MPWTCVRRSLAAIAWMALVGTALPAVAAPVSLTGNLDPDDPNALLVVQFSFAGGPLTIQSYGFGGSGQAPGGRNAAGTVIAAGGFDTYFSLFAGAGPSATFLVSNDDGLCPPADDAVACRDSRLDFASLAGGTYTLVLSVFDNFSFAENLGGGVLGDGFIGLGSYFNEDSLSFTTSAYAIDLAAEGLVVSVIPNGVPEPEPWQLVLPLAAFLHRRRARHRPDPTPCPPEVPCPIAS